MAPCYHVFSQNSSIVSGVWRMKKLHQQEHKETDTLYLYGYILSEKHMFSAVSS